MRRKEEVEQAVQRLYAYGQVEYMLDHCQRNKIVPTERDFMVAKEARLYHELRYKNYSEVEKLLEYYQSITLPALKAESTVICFRQLTEAVRLGDTAGIVLFFKYGYKHIEWIVRTVHGYKQKSFLCIALEIGNPHVIDLLLTERVNVKTLKHKTAFAVLGEYGHKNVIEDLKEQWTDTDPPLKDCLEEALRSAAQHDQLALVEFLCTQNIDIHALGESGSSALMLAALHGKKSVVEALLPHNHFSENIARAFVHAAVYAIEKIKSAAPNDNGDPYEIMGILFKHGADINSVDQAGDTIFIKAADYPEFLTKIFEAKKLKRSINIDYENEKTGETALSAAAKKSNLAAVNILRANGADCNKVSSQGKTLIMTAIEHSPFEFVKALMALPITYNPGALLSSAVFLAKLDIAQFLLDKHTYNANELWSCVVALSHVPALGKNLKLSEQLALQMLLILTSSNDFDPNDIQAQLPVLINSAVNNQQILLLSKLLDLQKSPNKLMLNSFILTALSDRKFERSYALIRLMVERAEPTYGHLKSWQTMMQVHDHFSPPSLTTAVMARLYLKVLLDKPAEHITAEFIVAAEPYEELIVDALLSNHNDDTIRSSIAINQSKYANGLSKFLHSFNPEPSELIEDSINRIQVRIEQIESKMMQSAVQKILMDANKNNDKHAFLNQLRVFKKTYQNNGLHAFVTMALEKQLLQSCGWLLDEMVETAAPTHMHLGKWVAISKFPVAKFSERAMAARYFEYLKTRSAEQVTPELMQAAEPYRALIVTITLETPEADVLEGYIRKDEKGYAHGFSKFLHTNAISSTTWSATTPWSTSVDESIKLIEKGIKARREADKDISMVDNGKHATITV